MRVCILLLSLLANSCLADSVEVDKSTSPDGKFYLSIEPSTDGHMFVSDMLQIRRSTDNKIVAAFEWAHLGNQVTSKSAQVLWKPDNTAFALTWNMARGWTGSEIYSINDSKWVEKEFPQFKGIYAGRKGWSERGKGHLAVFQWLHGNDLKVDFEDQLYWIGPGPIPALRFVAEDDWAYFHLTKNTKIEFLYLDPKTASEIQARYDEWLKEQNPGNP